MNILIHKREKKLKMILKKTFIKYLVTDFMEKQWKMYEIVWDWNWSKNMNIKIIQKQSYETFGGIHKSYENCHG